VHILRNTETPDGRLGFHQELLTIREDLQVRSLALRRAGDPDLAEDALQEAYCAVAQVKDPQCIENLRAYFCRVLINEIYHLRGQLGASSVREPEDLVEVRECGVAVCSPAPSRPVDETVGTLVLAQMWFERLCAQRECLTAAVRGRSADPDRYRDLIVAVAEQVLRAAIAGEASQTDTNESLRAAYPEWFGAEGCADNNAHQRLSRARADVRDLLKAVVSRDELLS